MTLLCLEHNVALQGDTPEAGDGRRNPQPLRIEYGGRDGKESPMACDNM